MTAPPGIESTKPGIRLRDLDFYATWARVTRAWGDDYNYNPANAATYGLQPNEKAPRFIFANQQVKTSLEPENDAPSEPGDLDGDVHADDNLQGAYPGEPWALQDYQNQDPDVVEWFLSSFEPNDDPNTTHYRKPTFFNLHAPYASPALEDAVYPAFGGANGYGSVASGQTLPAGRLHAGVPDKGFYIRVDQGGPTAGDLNSAYSLQMLDRAGDVEENDITDGEFGFSNANDALADTDFTQLGELMNVFLFGHELFGSDANGDGELDTYSETRRTFSEIIDVRGNENNSTTPADVGIPIRDDEIGRAHV